MSLEIQPPGCPGSNGSSGRPATVRTQLLEVYRARYLVRLRGFPGIRKVFFPQFFSLTQSTLLGSLTPEVNLTVAVDLRGSGRQRWWYPFLFYKLIPPLSSTRVP